MTLTTLDPVLDRLAEFESDSHAVVSLYLDLRPDARGKEAYKSFLEGAIKEQLDSYSPDESARPALEQDFEKIHAYRNDELKDATQTLAVFSSSGEVPLFEALQLDSPIDGHRLYVDREPHLFPLARLAEQHSGYAALLVSTNSARLFVFDAGAAQQQLTLRNKKGKRVSKGGWSQARYQRRSENLHLKHMKEVAAAVEQVVRDDDVKQILVAGDDMAMPLLRDELSPTTCELLVEVGGLDLKSGDDEVFRVTLEAFREADVQSDRELVKDLLDAYRSKGLGTISVAGVRGALEIGQADRLIVPAVPVANSAGQAAAMVESAGSKAERSQLDEKTVEDLVTLARRTDATVTFIEDARLLEPARGVGAMLRYRV